MEFMQLDTTSTLMNETKKKEENSDSFFIRFCRKKYKCVFLWLLSIIAVSQLFIIIFDKIDSIILTKVISNIFLVGKNNTRPQMNETTANVTSRANIP
jgi:hypothetical protein